MGFTRREWEARFGESPETLFDDRQTYIIVRDPTTAIYWSQGEHREQYFCGFRRDFSLTINGEYEPYGPPHPEWSSNWEDAQTYDSLRSANARLSEINGKNPNPYAAVVGPSEVLGE